MIPSMRLLALPIVGIPMLLVAGPSYAFNPEEHKILGDLGSQSAAKDKKITNAILKSPLVKFSHDPKGVRLVVKRKKLQ